MRDDLLISRGGYTLRIHTRDVDLTISTRLRSLVDALTLLTCGSQNLVHLAVGEAEALSDVLVDIVLIGGPGLLTLSGSGTGVALGVFNLLLRRQRGRLVQPCPCILDGTVIVVVDEARNPISQRLIDPHRVVIASVLEDVDHRSVTRVGILASTL